MSLPPQLPVSSQMQVRQTAQNYAEYLSATVLGSANPQEFEDILRFAEKHAVKDASLLRSLAYHATGENLARVLTLTLTTNTSFVPDLAATITSEQAKSLPSKDLLNWSSRFGFLGRTLATTITTLAETRPPAKPSIR